MFLARADGVSATVDPEQDWKFYGGRVISSRCWSTPSEKESLRRCDR